MVADLYRLLLPGDSAAAALKLSATVAHRKRRRAARYGLVLIKHRFRKP